MSGNDWIKGWTLAFVKPLNQRSLTQGMRCLTEFLISVYGWSLGKYAKVVLIRDTWVWTLHRIIVSESQALDLFVFRHVGQVLRRILSTVQMKHHISPSNHDEYGRSLWVSGKYDTVHVLVASI